VRACLLAIQSSTKISFKILPELILAQLDPRQNKIHNPEEICKTSIRRPKKVHVQDKGGQQAAEETTFLAYRGSFTLSKNGNGFYNPCNL
jgi:hypothetical protein